MARGWLITILGFVALALAAAPQAARADGLEPLLERLEKRADALARSDRQLAWTGFARAACAAWAAGLQAEAERLAQRAVSLLGQHQDLHSTVEALDCPVADAALAAEVDAWTAKALGDAGELSQDIQQIDRWNRALGRFAVNCRTLDLYHRETFWLRWMFASWVPPRCTPAELAIEPQPGQVDAAALFAHGFSAFGTGRLGERGLALIQRLPAADQSAAAHDLRWPLVTGCAAPWIGGRVGRLYGLQRLMAPDCDGQTVQLGNGRGQTRSTEVERLLAGQRRAEAAPLLVENMMLLASYAERFADAEGVDLLEDALRDANGAGAAIDDLARALAPFLVARAEWALFDRVIGRMSWEGNTIDLLADLAGQLALIRRYQLEPW